MMVTTGLGLITLLVCCLFQYTESSPSKVTTQEYISPSRSLTEYRERVLFPLTVMNPQVLHKAERTLIQVTNADGSVSMESPYILWNDLVER
jgi:hypothetical protein